LAIALVLSIRREVGIIALPLCPTLARQLLMNSWREAGRANHPTTQKLVGAGITSVATILAFSDLGELVAFFLAIVANHLDGFSKMAGMLGIDRALGKKGGTARAKSMTPERTLFQASSIFRWNYARPP
jgi:hypothetical protein